jgi:hypothetical protein
VELILHATTTLPPIYSRFSIKNTRPAALITAVDTTSSFTILHLVRLPQAMSD